MAITILEDYITTQLLEVDTWNGSAFEGIMSAEVPPEANFLVVLTLGSWAGYTITYDGVEVPERVSSDDGNAYFIRASDLALPSSGVNNLSVTSAGARTLRTIVIPLSGVDITSPVRDTSFSGGLSGTSASQTCDTEINDLVIAFVHAGQLITSNGGQTSIGNFDDGDGRKRSADYKFATDVTTSLGWTFSSAFHTSASVAYKMAPEIDGTVVFQDDFTDTDSTILSAHVPTIEGVSWGPITGESSATIGGNRFVSASGYVTTLYEAVAAQTVISGYVECEMNQLDSQSDNYLRLYLNYQDEDNHYFVEWRMHSSFRDVKLWKRSGGSDTQLGSTYSTGTLTDGTYYALRLTRSGNDISAMFDGDVVIGPVTDSTPINVASNAFIGRTNQTNEVYVDNFIVVSSGDIDDPFLRQSKASDSNTIDQTLTFDYDVVEGDLLVLCIGEGNDIVSPPNISDDLVSEWNIADDEGRGFMFYAKAAASGSCTITIDSSGPTSTRASALNFGGVDWGDDPFDAAATVAAVSTSPAVSGSVTPSGERGVMVSFLRTPSDVSATAISAGGYTLGSIGLSRVAPAYRLFTESDSYAATYTWSDSAGGGELFNVAFIAAVAALVGSRAGINRGLIR